MCLWFFSALFSSVLQSKVGFVFLLEEAVLVRLLLVDIPKVSTSKVTAVGGQERERFKRRRSQFFKNVFDFFGFNHFHLLER
jgi:hypothetical protein